MGIHEPDQENQTMNLVIIIEIFISFVSFTRQSIFVVTIKEINITDKH